MNLDYWRTTPWDRRQYVLIGATLDEMIEPDANVRVFEDLLKSLDWTAWEAEYRQRRGQPPYHPRVLATLILYCLTDGIYSSRNIEKACAKQIDIVWLMNGAKPDHSCICKFRRRFRDRLGDLGAPVPAWRPGSRTPPTAGAVQRFGYTKDRPKAAVPRWHDGASAFRSSLPLWALGLCGEVPLPCLRVTPCPRW